MQNSAKPNTRSAAYRRKKGTEAQEHIGLYCDAVASLPEKCRQVFLLRKIHGLAHKEIAERMGLWLSSVEKYVRQGSVTCRDYLAERENCNFFQFPLRVLPLC